MSGKTNKTVLQRPCGCKGIRFCLLCETEFCQTIEGVAEKTSFALSELDLEKCYEYCHLCKDKGWLGVNVWMYHPNHIGSSIDYSGVLLIPDFITREEEDILVKGCDSMEWDLSQSGRRKENFGPKTNFKKMKINGASFSGFPKFSETAQKKLNAVQALADFQTIEQCFIEYRPETGACIDPHIDDCWVWGERVISLSLISDSVLTMTKYQGGIDKYNLRVHYDSHPESRNPFSDDNNKSENNDSNQTQPKIVRILMPARSLLVLFGEARYEWEHSILRRDITDRRICVAFREFTKEYLEGGSLYAGTGEDIVRKAQLFWNCEKDENEMIL